MMTKMSSYKKNKNNLIRKVCLPNLRINKFKEKTKNRRKLNLKIPYYNHKDLLEFRTIH